jgi:glycine/D-amino acid oxidase-like deaminating enzyme
MGHVVVMDDSDAQLALTSYSQQLWDELAAQLPDEAKFVRTGTLWVAADAEEMAEVERKQGILQTIGVRTEVLDAKQLAQFEPNLRPGLAGGLRVPNDSVVYPPIAARWLLEEALNKGATLRSPCRVCKLTGQEVLLDNGTRLCASVTVNAAGSLAPILTPNLNIKPRKGHLVITDRYPEFVHHQIVELGYLKSAHQSDGDSVAFNIQPRRNGQLLIGSSRQYGSTDPNVEQAIVARMLQRAQHYMPGLASLSALRVWTGFRAATPDKLPVIGPCPEVPGLWLATGHEGLGITTSLATARLLVDQLLGRASAIDRKPYEPREAIYRMSPLK